MTSKSYSYRFQRDMNSQTSDDDVVTGDEDKRSQSGTDNNSQQPTSSCYSTHEACESCDHCIDPSFIVSDYKTFDEARGSKLLENLQLLNDEDKELKLLAEDQQYCALEAAVISIRHVLNYLNSALQALDVKWRGIRENVRIVKREAKCKKKRVRNISSRLKIVEWILNSNAKRDRVSRKAKDARFSPRGPNRVSEDGKRKHRLRTLPVAPHSARPKYAQSRSRSRKKQFSAHSSIRTLSNETNFCPICQPPASFQIPEQGNDELQRVPNSRFLVKRKHMEMFVDADSEDSHSKYPSVPSFGSPTKPRSAKKSSCPDRGKNRPASKTVTLPPRHTARKYKPVRKPMTPPHKGNVDCKTRAPKFERRKEYCEPKETYPECAGNMRDLGNPRPLTNPVKPRTNFSTNQRSKSSPIQKRSIATCTSTVAPAVTHIIKPDQLAEASTSTTSVFLANTSYSVQTNPSKPRVCRSAFVQTCSSFQSNSTFPTSLIVPFPRITPPTAFTEPSISNAKPKKVAASRSPFRSTPMFLAKLPPPVQFLGGNRCPLESSYTHPLLTPPCFYCPTTSVSSLSSKNALSNDEIKEQDSLTSKDLMIEMETSISGKTKPKARRVSPANAARSAAQDSKRVEFSSLQPRKKSPLKGAPYVRGLSGKKGPDTGKNDSNCAADSYSKYEASSEVSDANKLIENAYKETIAYPLKYEFQSTNSSISDAVTASNRPLEIKPELPKRPNTFPKVLDSRDVQYEKDYAQDLSHKNEDAMNVNTLDFAQRNEPKDAKLLDVNITGMPPPVPAYADLMSQSMLFQNIFNAGHAPSSFTAGNCALADLVQQNPLSNDSCLACCFLEPGQLVLGKELLRASYEGRTADVASLLNSGADVNFTWGSKWTPLHRAAWGGHAEVIALLVSWGADVNARTVYGFTALHIAAYNDKTAACVQLLVTAGADVDCRNQLGWTALHYAAESGRKATVQALLNAGADKMAKSNRGKTPYHVARSGYVRKLLSPFKHAH